jgi:hypothetical protein
MVYKFCPVLFTSTEICASHGAIFEDLNSLHVFLVVVDLTKVVSEKSGKFSRQYW